MRLNNKSFLSLCESINNAINYDLLLFESGVFSAMLDDTAERIKQAPNIPPHEAILQQTPHRSEINFDNPSLSSPNYRWIHEYMQRMPNTSLAEFTIPHTTNPDGNHTIHVGFVKNHPMSSPEHRGTYNIGFMVDGSERPDSSNLDPTNMNAQRGIFSGILDAVLAHALKHGLSQQDYSFGALNKSGNKWFGHMQSAFEELMSKYQRPQ